jgi:hypothetical protein
MSDQPKNPELENAMKILDELKRHDPVIQRGRSGELISAFKVFWDSHPTEQVFTRQTDGLLFTNRMIYYMHLHPLPFQPVPQEQPKKGK